MNGQNFECSVRVLSETDGEKRLFTAAGRLTRLPQGICLTYSMENSAVTVEMCGGEISMRREGDLWLRFFFRPSASTAGEIGLSPESAGRVGIFCECAETVLTEENGRLKKLTILLQYVLSFSDGKRERIRLRLTAERKNVQGWNEKEFLNKQL